ncbi:lysostaphin resistance A-like protein [Carboxylicivirga sp. N1Y90]|uniref:CPBP family intramembrane glutamic endopeptidase n=1 Tax=Carboxylicivirga fragile TaxID=3417571 RepID=UPI003D33575A|nr:CPBP family intramembrane metalloprotease [Marinilabiliaceae bacterium N1Y90]
MNHLESAFRGSNKWWAYIVVFLVTFLLAQAIGGIPLGIILTVFGDGEIDYNKAIDFNAHGINASLGLALMLLPFVVSFFALVLIMKPLHGRSFKSLINGTYYVRKFRIVMGFCLWGLIIAFATIVDYYLNISDYHVRFDLGKLLPLLVVSLLLLPFQTFYEELFVRGYLAQGIGVLTRNRILVLIIPSLLFALLHGLNPEVHKHGFLLMMANYLSVGLIFAIVSVLDDGIELAMGAHAANNIFISVFVTTESSALQTDALLLSLTDEQKWSDLLGVWLIGIVFIGVFAFKYKWSLQSLFKRIERPSV